MFSLSFFGARAETPLMAHISKIDFCRDRHEFQHLSRKRHRRQAALEPVLVCLSCVSCSDGSSQALICQFSLCSSKPLMKKGGSKRSLLKRDSEKKSYDDLTTHPNVFTVSRLCFRGQIGPHLGNSRAEGGPQWRPLCPQKFYHKQTSHRMGISTSTLVLLQCFFRAAVLLSHLQDINSLLSPSRSAPVY